jgi:hypothetical protein
VPPPKGAIEVFPASDPIDRWLHPNRPPGEVQQSDQNIDCAGPSGHSPPQAVDLALWEANIPSRYRLPAATLTAEPLDMIHRTGKLRTTLGVLAVAAVALSLRCPIASVPLERDEGEYGYIAQRWLAGEDPYRSAFDQKPPGVFAAYAVILTLFGTSAQAIHWGAQVYTLGTLGLIYLTGRQLFGRSAGFIAALLASYMTADRCVLGNAANTELFMILPLTAGLLATLKSAATSSAGWAAIAGVCGAAAMLLKQVALPDVALYGCILLASERHKVQLVIVYALAALAVVGVVVSYFAAVGALSEFLDCVVLHNLRYVSQVPWHDYASFEKFSVGMFQWCPILVLGLVAWLAPEPANEGATPPRWGSRRIAGWWLAASFAGVAVGGYFREHYFFQVIPPLAVLAGRGAVVIAGRLKSARPMPTAVVVAGCAMAFGILVMPRYWLLGSAAEKCRLLYVAAPFPEAVPVGEYLAANASPDDTIFVYGSESEIYFYAGRRSASRYIFIYPLLTPAPDVLARQHAAMHELIENRPRYIVVHRDVFPPVGGSPPEYFRDEVASLLNRDYRLVGVAGPGDTAVRPFAGNVPADRTMNPLVEHTLAVWRRRES